MPSDSGINDIPSETRRRRRPEDRVEVDVAKIEDALRRIGQTSPKPGHRAHADSLAEQVREFGYEVAAAIVQDGNLRRSGRGV